MLRHWVQAAPLVLALTLVNGCGGAMVPAAGEVRPLVVYRQEGGIRFQSRTLIVTTRDLAILRSEGCTARFRLSAAPRRRLRRAVTNVDLSSLADDYPAPPGAADVIAKTIVVGRDRVHIGDGSSLPVVAARKLAPLLDVLEEAVTRGERRCGRLAEGSDAKISSSSQG